MLLSMWLEFVSQPSCWVLGIRMYPRPPGNHALGKRRDPVEWSIGFLKSPFSFPLYRMVFSRAMTFCSWQRWCSPHFTTEETHSPRGQVTCPWSRVWYEKVQSFSSAPPPTLALSLPITEIAQWQRSCVAVTCSGKVAEVTLSKLVFPGETLFKLRMSVLS